MWKTLCELLLAVMATTSGVKAGESSTALVIVTTTNRWITGKERATDWDKVQTAVKMAKTLSSYIPTGGPIISAVFGVAEIIIDGHVSDKVAEGLTELTNQLTKLSKEVQGEVSNIKETCKGKNFKDIAIMTGAFSNILKEILTGPAQHRALKKEVFLSECKKNSILLLIYSIPELIISPKSFILKSPLLADSLHRYTTLNNTRNSITKLVNTMLFIDLFCAKFEHGPDLREKDVDPVVRSVIHVNAMVNRYVEVYKKEKYFTKMNDIVKSVTERIGHKDASETAAELMKTLLEVHTNDRFVIVASNNCPLNTRYSGHPDDVYVNADHKIMVYRSKTIHSMNATERELWGVAQRNASVQTCFSPYLGDIIPSVYNIGFAFYREYGCDFAIEYDQKLIDMKEPFDKKSGKALTCVIVPKLRAGKVPRSKTIQFPGQIVVFPA